MNSSAEMFQHEQVRVGDIDIHVVTAGDRRKPAILMLHGWPENWMIYERLMRCLCGEYYVVAIDLPGIGESTAVPERNDARTLARYVRTLVTTLALHDATLLGHDVGGIIVYAFLRQHRADIVRAVIMNTVVPGVEPWSEVVRSPYIWHFAFHSIPDLPEQLVAGKQSIYFDWFYDYLAGPHKLDATIRDRFVHAYLRPDALRTGFEWYRSFSQDATANAADTQPVRLPVLYMRGDREASDMDKYLAGFRAAGLEQLHDRVILESGHFSAYEQPEAVADALRSFARMRSREPFTSPL